MLFTVAAAQDILPRFSVNKLNDEKVLIQWRNPDTTLRQLSIQQSSDSLSGFRTILTMPDPRLEQNGTVFNRPLAAKMFYRIYLMYPKGKYLITPSRSAASLPPPKPIEVLPANVERPALNPTKIDRAQPTDVAYRELTPKKGNVNPPDTLTRFDAPASAAIQPVPLQENSRVNKTPVKPEPEKFIPSTRIFTHRDGYPFIQLPAEWDLSQTSIRFFLENDEPLFELNPPPLRSFRIDKTNFHRAGWYKFEIWLKGAKVESNRLYLPMEF